MDDEDDLSSFFEYKTYFTHVYVDLACNKSRDVLERTSKLNFFNGTRRFVFFGNSDDFSILDGINLDVNSEVTLIDEERKTTFNRKRRTLDNDLKGITLPVCTYVGTFILSR